MADNVVRPRLLVGKSSKQCLCSELQKPGANRMFPPMTVLAIKVLESGPSVCFKTWLNSKQTSFPPDCSGLQCRFQGH